MTLRHARNDADELAWQAFLYAAGELAPEEAAAFEDRLDADQAAREALAEAVALSAAVAGSGVPNTRRRLILRLTRPRLAALGVAAVVALALAPGLVWRPNEPKESGPAAGTSASSLALTWSGLQADARDETEPGHADLVAWLDLPAEPDPALEAPDADAEDGPPDWLVEAAALRKIQ